MFQVVVCGGQPLQNPVWARSLPVWLLAKPQYRALVKVMNDLRTNRDNKTGIQNVRSKAIGEKISSE